MILILLVSAFQRARIGVSAWITSAEGMECLVGQGFAPLGVRIGVSAWINLPVHRLIHRILVTAFRPGQLAGVTIAGLCRFQRWRAI